MTHKISFSGFLTLRFHRLLLHCLGFAAVCQVPENCSGYVILNPYRRVCNPQYCCFGVWYFFSAVGQLQNRTFLLSVLQAAVVAACFFV
jgi:hypothetical protein